MSNIRNHPMAALGVLVLGLFMTLLDLTIVNIAIPSILDGLHASLDQVLPSIAGDVARYRAEAQFIAGPYADAAAYYERSSKPQDLIRAALAYEKAGDSRHHARIQERKWVVGRPLRDEGAPHLQPDRQSRVGRRRAPSLPPR